MAGSCSPARLLLILGTLNFIEGVAAIGNSHFFVNKRTTLPAA